VIVLLSATVCPPSCPRRSRAGEGPDGFLLTKQELKESRRSRLTPSQAFIDLFWRSVTRPQHRDQRVQARLRAAHQGGDKQFAPTSCAADERPRRTLLLLGLPSRHSFVPRQPGPGQPGRGLAGYEDRATSRSGSTRRTGCRPTSRRSRCCSSSSRRGSHEDFPLERGDRRNAQAMKLIASAGAVLLHPKLTSAKLGLLPGSKAAGAASSRARDRAAPVAGRIRPTPRPSRDDCAAPAWISVRLPASAPAANEAIGRVRAAPTTRKPGRSSSPSRRWSRRRAPLRVRLPVDAGRGSSTSRCSAGTRWRSHDRLRTEPMPAEGPTSRILLGVDVRQERRPTRDPFTRGCTHHAPGGQVRADRVDLVLRFALPPPRRAGAPK